MSQTRQEVCGNFHSEWMKHLPQEVKKLPVLELCLPGTHDSQAYTMNRSQSVDTIRRSIFGWPIIHFIPNKIQNWVSNKVFNVASRWAITHGLDIKSQLESGIRYLDLRVVYNPEEQSFYGAHSFLVADPMDSVLSAIADFLRAHEEEVLVVSVRPEYDVQSTFHDNPGSASGFIVQLQSYLATWIYCPTEQTSLKRATLEDMIGKNKRLILIAGDKDEQQVFYQQGKNILWSDKDVYDKHWDDTVDTNEKYTKSLKRVKSLKGNVNHTQFNELSPNLTPNVGSVLKAEFYRFVGKYLLLNLPEAMVAPATVARWLEKTSLETLEKDWYPKFVELVNLVGLESVNVISTDFVGDPSVDILINKIIHHNQLPTCSDPDGDHSIQKKGSFLESKVEPEETFFSTSSQQKEYQNNTQYSMSCKIQDREGLGTTLVCQNSNATVQFLPKNSAQLESMDHPYSSYNQVQDFLEDVYDPHCYPIEYEGHSSLVCEGENTTLVTTSRFPFRWFDTNHLDANIVLFSAFLYGLKGIYAWWKDAKISAQDERVQSIVRKGDRMLEALQNELESNKDSLDSTDYQDALFDLEWTQSDWDAFKRGLWRNDSISERQLDEVTGQIQIWTNYITEYIQVGSNHLDTQDHGVMTKSHEDRYVGVLPSAQKNTYLALPYYTPGFFPSLFSAPTCQLQSISNPMLKS